MRVVFIGTGEIGVPTLHSLLQSAEHDLVGVITQPDKPAGRAQTLTPPAIKRGLGSTLIPVLQPPRIKSTEAIKQIGLWSPDAIVVIAYGQMIPREVLEIPPLACLNLHASLLPRHRGAAPIQAAILAGDRETGITVIYMDEGLDTGDILLQAPIEISAHETGGSLHDRLANLAPACLHEALACLASGTAPRTAQDSAVATYAPKLRRDDGRIDWSESAEFIERRIRAYNPWPGAFTKLDSTSGNLRSLKIFSAAVVDLGGEPGQILQSDNALIVATGGRALSLEEVQLEGKRRMSAAEFLRGFDVASAFCR